MFYRFFTHFSEQRSRVIYVGFETWYINRIVRQTQLQYCIKYTIGGGYMFRSLIGHVQAIR
jgi:hypothetical protein